MSAADDQKPFTLHFKDDTLISVSRATLQAVAEKLALSETQNVHYALARLRDEMYSQHGDKLTPLSLAQHYAVAKAEPKGKGNVIDSLWGD